MCTNFSNDHFTTAHSLSSKSKVSQVLMEFSDNVRILRDALMTDGAPEIVGIQTKFMKYDSSILEIQLWRTEAGQSLLS